MVIESWEIALWSCTPPLSYKQPGLNFQTCCSLPLQPSPLSWQKSIKGSQTRTGLEICTGSHAGSRP